VAEFAESTNQLQQTSSSVARPSSQEDSQEDPDIAAVDAQMSEHLFNVSVLHSISMYCFVFPFAASTNRTFCN
jgi:hypothetical protein